VRGCAAWLAVGGEATPHTSQTGSLSIKQSLYLLKMVSQASAVSSSKTLNRLNVRRRRKKSNYIKETLTGKEHLGKLCR